MINTLFERAALNGNHLVKYNDGYGFYGKTSIYVLEYLLPFYIHKYAYCILKGILWNLKSFSSYQKSGENSHQQYLD